MYLEGKSYYEIGKKLKKDPKTVYRWIGYARGAPTTKWDEQRRREQAAAVKKAWKKGMSVQEIAREMRMDWRTVEKRISGK